MDPRRRHRPPSPVPCEAGVYAWYFRTAPGSAPIDHGYDAHRAVVYIRIATQGASESRPDVWPATTKRLLHLTCVPLALATGDELVESECLPL
jgi:hypothetical protein